MRLLTTAEKSALSASRVRFCYLVELRFRDPLGFLRFTTAAHTMTINGREWMGAGGLLDIRLPDEDGSLEAHKAEITLDGLDPSVISLALNEDIEDAPCTVYLATFNPDTNQLIGVSQFHRGTVGQVRIQPPSSRE